MRTANSQAGLGKIGIARNSKNIGNESKRGREKREVESKRLVFFLE